MSYMSDKEAAEPMIVHHKALLLFRCCLSFKMVYILYYAEALFCH